MTVEIIKERLSGEPKLIEVLGPTGVGKTTFAHVLGDSLGIKVVEEQYTQNHYLEPFYNNPAKYSFFSQLHFLLDANDQVKDLIPIMKTISVVIDAGNEMNRLYAETHHDMGWMSNEEFGLYRRVDEALAEKNAFKTPDLRFFLSAPFEIVAERIRERGRMFELKMLDEHPEYFLRLNDVIEVFVGKQNNVIRIDTDKNDFIDETHINGIVEKISNIK